MAAPAEAKGSRVVTVSAAAAAAPERPLVMTLRPRQGIVWDPAVVDNEHMNKRSSKQCCIYHRPRAWDESDSESDGSDSDSDYEGRPGEPVGAPGSGQPRAGPRRHQHSAGCSHGPPPAPVAGAAETK